MSLIIPTIFFFLLNFSFSQTISLDIECENAQEGTNYYNSLEYNCAICEGIKGYHNDICYSNQNTKSIYTFENIFLPESPCETNQFFTELDEDKNLLENRQCANKNFNFDNITGNYTLSDYQDADLSIRYEDEFLYTFSSSKEYDYYRYSCLNGKFERSCDFMANLYALSLYSNNNIEVAIINELNDLLHENLIL